MMATVDMERLIAYVDGELDLAEERDVEAAIAADPALAAAVEAFRTQGATLKAAFNEPLRGELPERLVTAVYGASANPGRQRRSAWAMWRQPVAGAIAASIAALVVGLSGAYYFAERGIERELTRLEAFRDADHRMLETATSQVLESRVSGTAAGWHNPDSGSRGTVKPLRTFKIASGEWCREYRHVLEFRGWQERNEVRRAIACRIGDGQWQTRLSLPEES